MVLFPFAEDSKQSRSSEKGQLAEQKQQDDYYTAPMQRSWQSNNEGRLAVSSSTLSATRPETDRQIALGVQRVLSEYCPDAQEFALTIKHKDGHTTLHRLSKVHSLAGRPCTARGRQASPNTRPNKVARPSTLTSDDDDGGMDLSDTEDESSAISPDSTAPSKSASVSIDPSSSVERPTSYEARPKCDPRRTLPRPRNLSPSRHRTYSPKEISKSYAKAKDHPWSKENLLLDMDNFKEGCSFRVDDEVRLMQWYYTLFYLLSQSPLKKYNKEWIKLAEPNKQSTYPYSSNNPKNRKGWLKSQPSWWPPVSKFVEPDHGTMHDRIHVSIALMRLSREKAEGWIEKLKDKVQYMPPECNAKDQEYSDKALEWRKRLLDTIWYLAQKDEDHAHDNIDGSSIVNIEYLPKPPQGRVKKSAAPSLKSLSESTSRKRARESRSVSDMCESDTDNMSAASDCALTASFCSTNAPSTAAVPSQAHYPAENMSFSSTIPDEHTAPQSVYGDSSERSTHFSPQMYPYEDGLPNTIQNPQPLRAYGEQHFASIFPPAGTAETTPMQPQPFNAPPAVVTPQLVPTPKSTMPLGQQYALYDAKGGMQDFNGPNQAFVSPQTPQEVYPYFGGWSETAQDTMAMPSLSTYATPSLPISQVPHGLPYQTPGPGQDSASFPAYHIPRYS